MLDIDKQPDFILDLRCIHSFSKGNSRSYLNRIELPHRNLPKVFFHFSTLNSLVNQLVIPFYDRSNKLTDSFRDTVAKCKLIRKAFKVK